MCFTDSVGTVIVTHLKLFTHSTLTYWEKELEKLKEKKKRYNLIITSDNKSKSFWNIIKESGKNENAEQIPLTRNSNNTVTHLHQAADVFNKYFFTFNW
jgi:hypothetical protein